MIKAACAAFKKPWGVSRRGLLGLRFERESFWLAR